MSIKVQFHAFRKMLRAASPPLMSEFGFKSIQISAFRKMLFALQCCLPCKYAQSKQLEFFSFCFEHAASGRAASACILPAVPEALSRVASASLMHRPSRELVYLSKRRGDSMRGCAASAILAAGRKRHSCTAPRAPFLQRAASAIPEAPRAPFQKRRERHSHSAPRAALLQRAASADSCAAL